MGTYIQYPLTSSGGINTYANFASLPGSADDGTPAITLDTDTLYIYNLATTTWKPVGAPGTPFSVGTIDSGSASNNGAHIDTNALIMQSASATKPGLVNLTTQSFAGNKTFTGTIGASNLSGTNTGDVTIGTANGLSLASQAISLQAADSSHTGALTSTDWSTFNGKQAAGSYITALTGEVTASGPGSVAATVVSVGGSLAAAVNTATVLANNATSANTASQIVKRDGSGNFIAGTITATLTGNVTGNVTGNCSGTSGSFTGNLTGDVTSVGMATTIGATKVTNSMLAGSITASKLVGSDISTVGTITAGTWNGTAIDVPHGGTGIASGTSGGVPYFSGSTTIASSGALTNHGVVIGGGAGATPKSTAAGSSGQVLTSNGASADPTFQDAAITPVAPNPKVTTYTATTADGTILADASGGAWTLSLYTAVGNSGRQLTIVRTDNTPANALTIDPSGSETIKGALTRALYTSGETVVIQSDGANWQVLSHYTSTPWTSTTLTFAGFGTLASQSSWWRRVGDTYYARGWITTGTVSGTTASLSPQSGIVIDSAKLDSTANLQRVGFIDRTGSTTTYTALGPLPIFYDGSTTGSLFMSGTTSASYAFVKEAGSSSFNTSGKYPFEFSIPVSGWWE